MSDPRRPGDDNAQPGHRSLPPVEWDDYGPVAPEPEWERRPEQDNDDNFNRERFILRCVAWIIGVHFGLFIVAGLMCSYMAVKLLEDNRIFRENTPKICPNTEENIRRSAGESLAVLLALLGGGSIARGEQQRREERRQQQIDPRRGDRLPPSR